MALRMAIDLSLHLVSRQTPRNNAEALELANHTRTWSACLLLDSWNVVKHGRLPTLREPEHEIRVQDVRSLQTEFERRIFKAVNEFMQFAKAGNAVSTSRQYVNVCLCYMPTDGLHGFDQAL
jgi:hypothetical protein